MPRLYGERSEVSRQPDQNSGIAIRLNPEAEPAPEAEPCQDCECADLALYWYNTSGESPAYDLTSITLTSVPGTAAYPKAALVGETCPGADVTGINAAWVGGTLPPVYAIAEIDQTWALVVQLISSTVSTQRNGTLTLSGTVVCNGENISVGPITLTINIAASTPSSTPPS